MSWLRRLTGLIRRRAAAAAAEDSAPSSHSPESGIRSKMAGAEVVIKEIAVPPGDKRFAEHRGCVRAATDIPVTDEQDRPQLAGSGEVLRDAPPAPRMRHAVGQVPRDPRNLARFRFDSAGIGQQSGSVSETARAPPL